MSRLQHTVCLSFIFSVHSISFWCYVDECEWDPWIISTSKHFDDRPFCGKKTDRSTFFLLLFFLLILLFLKIFMQFLCSQMLSHYISSRCQESSTNEFTSEHIFKIKQFYAKDRMLSKTKQMKKKIVHHWKTDDSVLHSFRWCAYFISWIIKILIYMENNELCKIHIW